MGVGFWLKLIKINQKLIKINKLVMGVTETIL